MQVHKILGPGNQYVTAAKMIVSNSEAMVAMDMPAGPSEVLVIADSSASPAHVAADLLSQAEHGPDSQVDVVLWWFFIPYKRTTYVWGTWTLQLSCNCDCVDSDPDMIGLHSGKDMEVLKSAHWPDHILCSLIFTLSGCCCGRCRLKHDAHICVTLMAIEGHFYMHTITCVVSLLWRPKVIIA